jgi:phosphate starvation-inducible protein PhoH
MKFSCKRIEIHDDAERLSVTFWEKEEVDIMDVFGSFDEFLASMGKYLMFQYNVADNEYYIESSKDGYVGELKALKIQLGKTKLWVEVGKKTIEVELCADDNEFEKIEKVLTVIVGSRGELNVI